MSNSLLKVQTFYLRLKNHGGGVLSGSAARPSARESIRYKYNCAVRRDGFLHFIYNPSVNYVNYSLVSKYNKDIPNTHIDIGNNTMVLPIITYDVMPDYTINCKHFFGHNWDYSVTRNAEVSQRHTFAITMDIKLCLFACYDRLIQIKAVDVYKLGDTDLTSCADLVDGNQYLGGDYSLAQSFVESWRRHKI